MKKQYKQLYRSVKKPQIIDCPKLPIISLEGEGDPNNNPQFEAHIGALYQLSYGFRMSYKTEPIDGYYTYSVGSLEGFWTTRDGNMYNQNKDNLKYKIFIVQPDFVTEEVFKEYQTKLTSKNELISSIKFEFLTEGKCGQILHVGPFDTEPESVTKLEQFLDTEWFKIVDDSHHEIYLSDFRRVTEDKYKTLIRYQIEEK